MLGEKNYQGMKLLWRPCSELSLLLLYVVQTHQITSLLFYSAYTAAFLT